MLDEIDARIQFRVQYVKGKENVVANSLLHKPFLNVVSLVKDNVLDNITGFYGDDVFYFVLFFALTIVCMFLHSHDNSLGDCIKN